MSNAKSVLFGRTALTVLLLSLCPYVRSQSPYGLAARQTIPFVIDGQDERGGGWTTEIDIHNPNSPAITLRLTYFGAVGTPNAGQWSCDPQTVGPFLTAEFSLRSACPFLTNFGVNFGRLELSALPEFPGPSDDPAAVVFLTNARVSGPGERYFTVEGFPQGNLSGNKSFAKVTGLKSGLQADGSLWQSSCYTAALNEAVTAEVELGDKNGPLGVLASVNLDPVSGIEMWPFMDVFQAVGAPGNYDNVTASFYTPGGTGGAGGPGLLAFCRITNLSLHKEVFAVAKYVDNNDEARQLRTSVMAWVSSETERNNEKRSTSNLHLAHFQHPDRVLCTVRFLPNPNFNVPDPGQMRLIDPDGKVAALGTPLHAKSQSFMLDLGDKSQRHGGRNGRWLVEVGPDRTHKPNCGDLCSGGPDATQYELTCSSGNGHSQLDRVGYCDMDCKKDPNAKDQATCQFGSQVDAQRCYY